MITKEQERELWEWCGIKPRADQNFQEHHGGWHYVYEYPDGHLIDILPPIDLNNLFKYAVLKLHAWTMGSCPDGDVCAVAVIKVKGDYCRGESCSEDPILALFWAIWEVITTSKSAPLP